MSAKPWTTPGRILHAAITLIALFQQLTSLYMSDPPTQYLFPWHEYGGIAGLGILLLFWLYSYAVFDLGMLFPWGVEGRRVVAEELRALLRGRLPPPGRRAGLSSLVHGLGILAMTGCALSGWRIFDMIPSGDGGLAADPEAFTRMVLIHKFFGGALWVYLLGHVGFALVHQARGEPVLRAIFGSVGGRSRVE